MKPLVSLGVVFALFFVSGICADSPSAFDQLKSLVGQWQAKGPDGHTVTASYELVSGGTALMERLKPGVDHEMITMYHPDNDSILMTHYCEANNQPRMQTASAEGGKSLTFSFVDVANLKNDEDGHMRNVVLTFVDKDHFNAEWTYREKGKETAMLFQFARVQ